MTGTSHRQSGYPFADAGALRSGENRDPRAQRATTTHGRKATRGVLATRRCLVTPALEMVGRNGLPVKSDAYARALPGVRVHASTPSAYSSNYLVIAVAGLEVGHCRCAQRRTVPPVFGAITGADFAPVFTGLQPD